MKSILKKNTFINLNLKLALINTVACVALMNNGGYTRQMNMMFENNASPMVNNMMNFVHQQKFNNNMMWNNNVMPNNNNNVQKQQKHNIGQQKLITQPKNIYEKALNKINSNEITHTRGLENIGATCYMNAVLQCLANLKSFVEPTLKAVNAKSNTLKQNGNEGEFAIELAKLFANLWYQGSNDKKTYYTPTEFKKALGNANPLFKGIAANDSKDLIIFISETLHILFNNPKPVNYTIGNIDLVTFLNNYFSQNQSYLTDLFYFIQKNNLDCYNCHFNKASYNIANIMISPLEKVREMKLQNRNNKLNTWQMMQLQNLKFQQMLNPTLDVRDKENEIIGPVTLEDCIENYQEAEGLSGQNQIYCNHCRQMSNATTKNTLFSLPKVMTVILNRGQGLEYNVPVNFQKTTTIYEYASGKWIQYRLKSFITHLGDSSMSGHFVANVLDDKGKWWFYNDAIVTQQTDTEVNQKLYSTSLNNIPYVLFYERVEDNVLQTNNLINNNNMGWNNNMGNMNWNMMNAMWNMNMNGMNGMGNMNMNGMNNMSNANNGMPMNMNAMNAMWNMNMNRVHNMSNANNGMPMNNMNLNMMNNNKINNVNPYNNMMMQQNYNNFNYNKMQNFIPINQNNIQNKLLNNAQFLAPMNNMQMNNVNAMNQNQVNNNWNNRMNNFNNNQMNHHNRVNSAPANMRNNNMNNFGINGINNNMQMNMNNMHNMNNANNAMRMNMQMNNMSNANNAMRMNMQMNMK